MNQLEPIHGIGLSDLDPDNLFYSVISKCKEKGVFREGELFYVDSSLNTMLEETAKYCGKGYIKQDTAVIMLKNVFMILDSLYSLSDFGKIIDAVKEKKLYEMWKSAVSKSSNDFERAIRNLTCLEHLSRKNPELCAGFALGLKNDIGLSNIFTFSLDRAVFTKEFFGFGERTDYSTLCDKTEILCTEFGFVGTRRLEELYPILSARGAVKREGVVTYTSSLLDYTVISMCFAAFYRCDGIFPNAALSREILEILNAEEEDELCDTFLSYLHIAAARYEIPIADYEDTLGESMVNLYATRVNERNLLLLARHLTGVVLKCRDTDVGKTVHFI